MKRIQKIVLAGIFVFGAAFTVNASQIDDKKAKKGNTEKSVKSNNKYSELRNNYKHHKSARHAESIKQSHATDEGISIPRNLPNQ